MDPEEHLPKGKKWLCQRCGNCCRRPGPVIITGKEIDNMANFLKMKPENFLEQYVAVTPDGENLTLVSKPDESCILLDGTNKCMVNDTKPEQCSGFPNTWFFEGWRDMCGAILINEKDFDQAVVERDHNFPLNE